MSSINRASRGLIESAASPSAPEVPPAVPHVDSTAAPYFFYYFFFYCEEIEVLLSSQAATGLRIHNCRVQI